ncbi:MAG: nicotinate (nicotinamide) nucleotide adenylyltransferase [Thermomicrobiales bacterium]|nr:nicotinate (nicotinamide) nucleotide adenylyltransferase [Thermomicrobiales bacterium]
MTDEPIRIGFFGGTFDPIHHGHLILASYAASSARLDRLLFAPAANPPHKDRKITPVEHRIEMLLRATADDHRFEMTTGRSRSRWTILLGRYPRHSGRRSFPGAQLSFLMGGGSAWDLPKWYEPLKLFDHADLLVGLRPHSVFDEDELWAALPPARSQTHFVDIPLIEISSTEVRHRVSRQLPIDYLVPRAVQDYIERTGLYLDAVDEMTGRRILD